MEWKYCKVWGFLEVGPRQSGGGYTGKVQMMDNYFVISKS